MNIIINDLEQNSELDARAMAHLVGGSASYVGTRAGLMKTCRFIRKARDGNRKYKPCKFGVA